MKKLKKFVKAVLVFAIIIFPFFYFTNMFFMTLFSFNVFSPQDWSIIKSYWDNGGVIKTPKDTMFLFSIIFNPLFFIIIWRHFYKKSFAHILLYPVRKYNNYIIKKYGNSSKRIILRNICRSESKTQEIEALKPNVEASKKATQKIREAVRNKLTNN